MAVAGLFAAVGGAVAKAASSSATSTTYSVLALFSVALGLAALVGGAVYVGRGTRMKTVIDNLRAEVADMVRQRDEARADRDELRQHLADAEAANQRLAADMKVVTDRVTNTAAIDRLIELLQKVLAQLGHIGTAVDELDEAVKANGVLLRRRPRTQPARAKGAAK